MFYRGGWHTRKFALGLMGESPGRLELTQLLRDLSRGENRGSTQAMLQVVAELKSVARSYLRRQTSGQTLQPTALVNEAYLKLFDRDELELRDRRHFFALAARTMRQVIVDHARERGSLKRGGGQKPISICEPGALKGGVDVDILDLHAALEELSERDERQGRIVELRYFGGLEVAEVAAVVGVSKTTVEREWRMARAWLGNRMRREREL